MRLWPFRVLFLSALLGIVGAVPALAQANYVERPAVLDAAGECVALDVQGMGSGTWQIAGTFVGTIEFTIAGNDGDYVSVNTFSPTDPDTAVTGVTDSSGVFRGDVSAMRSMRACMDSFTSGSARVTLAASLSGGGVSSSAASVSVTTGAAADGSGFTAGNNVIPAGLVRRDTPGPGTGVADGDLGAGSMSEFGGIYTQLLDDTGAIASFATDAQHGQAVPTTGPQLIGEAKAFDGSALPNTVSEGQAIRLATTASGVLYTMNVNHTGAIDRSSGCTPGSILADGTDETEIKATSGTLHSLSVFHINDAPVALHLYNDTAANTDETDTPVINWYVPANSTATLGAGAALSIPDGGISFSTAITFRAVKGIALNSTTALDASEVYINYCYK